MSSYTSGAVAGPLWRQRYRYGNGGLPPLNEAVAMPIELVGPMSNSAMYKGWMLTGECGGGSRTALSCAVFTHCSPKWNPMHGWIWFTPRWPLLLEPAHPHRATQDLIKCCRDVVWGKGPRANDSKNAFMRIFPRYFFVAKESQVGVKRSCGNLFFLCWIVAQIHHMGHTLPLNHSYGLISLEFTQAEDELLKSWAIRITYSPHLARRHSVGS